MKEIGFRKHTKEFGFAPLLIIFLIILLLFVVIIIPKLLSYRQSNFNQTILTSPSPEAEAIPVATNFPTPTLVPTSIPTVNPTPHPAPLKTQSPKPITPAPVSGPPGAGYSSITVATEKGNFAASVLSVNLNSARMITDTGNEGDCGSECTVLPLQDYMTRNNGFAGVNGTYFCPATYPDCAGKTNSYDFPVYNTKLGHWINAGYLFWNSRSIFYVDGSGAHFMQNSNGFSGGLTAGIVNYPGLISDGVVQIDDSQSGLSDKQKAVGTKVGIGLRDSKNVMVVIAKNVNMQQFAYIFKSLGAQGALNLDTGGSTAFYYNGKYLYGPGRAIPNAIIFAR